MQHMPPGVSLTVPDLSKFGPQQPSIDFSYIKVTPGDSVMVVLPRNTNMAEMAQIKKAFIEWEPRVSWLIVAGVEQVTQIVPNPDPTEDKAPQGQDDVDLSGPWSD